MSTRCDTVVVRVLWRSKTKQKDQEMFLREILTNTKSCDLHWTSAWLIQPGWEATNNIMKTKNNSILQQNCIYMWVGLWQYHWEVSRSLDLAFFSERSNDREVEISMSFMRHQCTQCTWRQTHSIIVLATVFFPVSWSSRLYDVAKKNTKQFRRISLKKKTLPHRTRVDFFKSLENRQ